MKYFLQISVSLLLVLVASTTCAYCQATKSAESSTQVQERKIITVRSDYMFGMLVKYTTPEYPKEAKAKKIRGDVEAKLLIDEAGNVEKVLKIEGPIELQQATLDAIKKWQFRGYKFNWKTVAVYTTFKFKFAPGQGGNDVTYQRR